jgi:membrane protein YdbS with pleckstrin-like domain
MKGPSNLAHENGLIIVSLVIIIGLISILSIYTYQYWYYKTYFYNITDEYLIIHKGIIAPQEVTLPLKRIQDVYVDQDILDQLFGLYDVHFSSATATSGQKAHIDGLEKEVAEKFREFILHKIK